MTRFSTPHGIYCIDPTPNQPQLAVCHSFFVPVSKRGQGVGRQLKLHQCQKLVDLHYDYAICTVRADNYAQIKILEKCGWSPLTDFQSSSTGVDTIVWGWKVSQHQLKEIR